jgi:hypothetical protein
MRINTFDSVARAWVDQHLTKTQLRHAVGIMRAVGAEPAKVRGARHYGAGTFHVQACAVEQFPDPSMGICAKFSQLQLGDFSGLDGWLEAMGKDAPVTSAEPLADRDSVKKAIVAVHEKSLKELPTMYTDTDLELVNSTAESLFTLYTAKHGYGEIVEHPNLDRILLMAYSGLRPRGGLGRLLDFPAVKQEYWIQSSDLETDARTVARFGRRLEAIIPGREVEV